MCFSHDLALKTIIEMGAFLDENVGFYQELIPSIMHSALE